ncbi:MAG: hypothetical protein JWN35_2323 [Frankiales bacterium]|jgi:uncharacterized protein with FMN-binding domain|nr:hypothetical protein [Frankiales bacterium]
MRRNVTAAGSTVAGLVLLFNYHTSTSRTLAVAGVPLAGSGTTGTTSTPGVTPVSPTTTTATAPSTAPSTAPAAVKKTVTGTVAQTQWGPVQVQITVQGKKILSATVLQIPSGNPRDQEINSYAVPILNQEASSASSAQIDTVSGATVTSDGYIQSLQAAIDMAHLA